MLIFGCYSIFRLVRFLFGNDFRTYDAACDSPEVIEQQLANSNDEDFRVRCVDRYNPEFDSFEKEFMIGVMALRVFNLIYCIICFKYRHLSNNILYLECLFRMVAATVPKYINEDKANFAWGQEIGLTFVTFYCD